MPVSRDMLQSFSSLLHALYGAAHEMPPEEFHAEVLRLMKSGMDFDSGMWAAGQPGRDHWVHMHNQPIQLLESYRRVSHEDTVVAELVAHPGRPLRCNVGARYPAGSRSKSGVRDHMKRFDIGNAIMICTPERALGLLNWMVLWRRQMDAQFTLEDGFFFQALWPHLTQALAVNRQLNLDHLYLEEAGTPPAALAVVDRKGVVWLARPEFDAAMRNEWPAWTRPLLPRVVLEAMFGHGLSNYLGKCINLEFRKASDLFFVRARPLTALHRLTRRETQIAARFSSGLSYKEIARELAISPATVRNRLQDIYRKLNVGDKAELATLLATLR